jgi:hypothetical protein
LADTHKSPQLIDQPTAAFESEWQGDRHEAHVVGDHFCVECLLSGKVQGRYERRSSGAKPPSEYVASVRELSQARQFGACLKDADDDFENSTIPIFAYVRGCAFP